MAFTDELASMPIGQTVISFLNANNANLMMTDPEYRAILGRHVVLPDGHGVDLASRLFHGRMFPANLNGTDFVPALMTYMTKPKRIALIGASPSVLAKAVENFRKHAPWHEFIPIVDGYFDMAESDEIMARVRAARPDILLVAMGSPKQEKWIDRYVGPGHARLVMSVGALFDFMGEVPRASATVRRLRLEWLHRLVHEPGRLWRRYIIGNPLFVYYILRHKLLGRGKKTRTDTRRAGSF
ncbi:WecB/TagA/CpsF family glycosyltransferase [Rhizobium sp. 32-5/1]|uniref:WecB/TagA/CpsF family glycosyltransferase n=1 Tax=Rhizobium sp. 32-5/1 TaxID=3019602 RepID=UPI00240D85C9|nr:WecB/TagA/CpsF family glycosyltransferase [Rhizobium sp. 32-5/1]WEZ84384.1 WecB/TagA/CpsF family glycosyltransferase [Rhizobium sp. 32-5/1]